MIDFFLVIFSNIILYEFIKYVKFISIMAISIKLCKKVLRLFKFKNVSDTRKEQLLFSYSKSIFLNSIKGMILICVIIIYFIFLNYFFSSYIQFMKSGPGLLAVSLVFYIYHLIRSKVYAKLQ